MKRGQRERNAELRQLSNLEDYGEEKLMIGCQDTLIASIKY